MIKTWVDTLSLKAMAAVRRVMNSERGDTNFISILIVMGIVILLAGLFIGFKDKIVAMVGNIVNGFTIS